MTPGCFVDGLWALACLPATFSPTMLAYVVAMFLRAHADSADYFALAATMPKAVLARRLIAAAPVEGAFGSIAAVLSGLFAARHQERHEPVFALLLGMCGPAPVYGRHVAAAMWTMIAGGAVADSPDALAVIVTSLDASHFIDGEQGRRLVAHTACAACATTSFGRALRALIIVDHRRLTADAFAAHADAIDGGHERIGDAPGPAPPVCAAHRVSDHICSR